MITCTTGYQIAIINQPACYTIAQGMAFPKKEISDKEIAPHQGTLILYLGLPNKGNSASGLWSGESSALNCLQASLRSYNELPLAWLTLLY